MTVKRAVIALAVCLTWLPLLWLISVAFRRDASFLMNSVSLLPSEFSGDGLASLFADAGYRLAMINALLIGAATAAAGTMIAFAAGYFVSVRASRGDRRLALTLISFRFLPAAAILPAIYWLATITRMVDTIAALVLLNLLPSAGLGVLLVAPAIMRISNSHVLVAQLEGASEPRVLFRVVLPEIRSSLVVTFIVLFAFAWNEYLFSSVLSQTSASQPLPVVVAGGIGQYRVKFSMIASAGVISLLPSALAATFLIFQFAWRRDGRRAA